MKVSFVIPAYQVEKYIGSCIESIQNQTTNDWELIIIDDGSYDNTLNIVKKYAQCDSRITVVHQNNQGVSAARNVGITLAKGQWIAFIDGDDLVAPDLLEKYKKYLSDDNDICFISYQDVDEKKLDNFSKYKKNSILSNYQIIKFSQNDFLEFQLATFNRDLKGKYDYHKIKLAMPGKFYRRTFLLKNKIEFPVGIPTGEDAIFNLYAYRYAKKGVFIDAPLYFHRVWRDSVSKKYNPNAESDFSKLHSELRKFIGSSENPSMFDEVYEERLAWSFGFCCILNYCHVNNPLPYRIRKQMFLIDLNKYKKSFTIIRLAHFKLQKKIMFYFIKKGAFNVVSVLCWVNRKN